MKIRKGFVSNSSSSSFVLANKTGDTKTMIEVDLSVLIENTIKTIEDLDEFFLEKNTWSSAKTLDEIFEEDEYLKDEYAKYRTKLKAGYILFAGEVGSEGDDPLSYYFYNNSFEGIKGFEVLREGN